MHDLIEIAWRWASRSANRFMVFLLLLGVAGGAVVMMGNVYDAWKADPPSTGREPRHRRRPRPERLD